MKRKLTVSQKLIAVSTLLILASLPLQAEKKTFDALAKPLITSTIQYGTNDVYRGFITYAARPGQILHGPTYDIDGKLIKHGDILISIAKDYNQSLVEQAKSQVSIAKSNLAYMKIEYERYKDLDQSSAVSKEQYQTYINNYYQALSQLNQDREALKARQIELDLCDYRVEYDCIVDKTLMPFGLCAGELPVQIISQMDPMGINIKMDRATARKITPQTPVTIYPMNGQKPVGILPHLTLLTDEGVTFRVRNFAVDPKNIVDGKNIPIVKCFIVLNLYTNKQEDEVGVPKDAICRDDNGYYVWKAVGQKSNQPGKGIDNVFPVKKAYVKLGKISRYCGNYVYYYSVLPLKNSLEVNDLVVINPPNGLKDNDKVCYYNEVYTFMPGDTVKVDIEL